MRIAAKWLHWPETQTLIAAFGDRPLRFVGGCVRDAVLSRPVQDVDAATPAPSEQVMLLLREHNIKVVPTGIDHGTVTAVIGGKHFEITTLRRDVSTDGRHAKVAYTNDWREDAARRDFTMNALYCDAGGEVTDFFGGTADARAGIVKFIGEPEQRIREDALRIFRFFRFFAHYGSAPMHAESLEACAALGSLIEGLSGERIQQEMLKLLPAARAAEVIEVMQGKGVLLPVLGCKTDTRPLGCLPAALHAAGKKPDAILALAALLRSAEGDKTQHVENIYARWKLSNANYKRLKRLCLESVQPGDETVNKKQIRALGKDHYTDLVILHMAEGGKQQPTLVAIHLASSWSIPTFPVSGDDVKAHGIHEGKAVGETLKMLEAKWEEGGYVASKEELLKDV